jgi:N utilization substance protein A
MDVVVADDQLSLAIGRKGQNVRLVAKLTGWKIDVRAEGTEVVVSSEDKRSLESLEDIDPALVEMLMEAGYKTIDDLAKAKEEDLLEFEGIDETLAKKIIQKAVVGAGEV